ncbi:MAG: peptidylprolyl isomerase [Planctomycetes bacterium]|nr:peptidylprolyl isomerase [Planctomycetota bacterium]
MLLATAFVLGALLAPAPRPAPVWASAQIVAQALDATVSAEELENLLYIRRAASEDGRATLRHLAETKLVEKLAAESRLQADEAELDRRTRAFDLDIKKGGDAEGLAGHLRRARLSREEFRRFLTLAIFQETLTRRALGLGDDKPVTADQQRLWIEEELGKRGFQPLAPPWKDGVAARAADFTISGPEFLSYLRKRLPADTLEEDCFQLLLEKRMLARMPDLAPEKLAAAVQAELQRRRDEARLDPKNKGIALDQILAAQGVVVERLREDPALRISALSKLWVERSYDAETLKRVYQDEREWFDGHYGPAHEVGFLFLRAAGFKNQLNPRTFEEAERELEKLRARARTREEFRELAKVLSEDADTKSAGGELGWVSPLSPRVPREVRDEVARRLALPEGDAQGLSRPLRLPNGVALLWIARRRPAPAWETMAGHVRSELRRRFVEDVLPRSAVVLLPESP